MAWVGGGILLHGLHEFGMHAPGHVLESIASAAAKAAPGAAGIMSWTINALGSALFGLVAGAILIPIVHMAAPLTRAAGKLFSRPKATPLA